jgi:multidrug efflux pump subunit AcrB
MLAIHVSSTTLIRVDKARSARSAGGYVNTATVTMTLYNSAGTAVTGASNLPLSYVTGTDGRYEGTLPSTLSLTPGASYLLVVTIDPGGGQPTQRRIACRAEYDDQN